VGVPPQKTRWQLCDLSLALTFSFQVRLGIQLGLQPDGHKRFHWCVYPPPIPPKSQLTSGDRHCFPFGKYVKFRLSHYLHPSDSGNLNNAGLRNTLGGVSTGSPLIPQLLYAFFQMEFACVTVRNLSPAFTHYGILTTTYYRLLSSSERWQNGVERLLLCSSPSYGPPSSIALLPTGCGLQEVGLSNGA
jgi:hypothetical protein